MTLEQELKEVGRKSHSYLGERAYQAEDAAGAKALGCVYAQQRTPRLLMRCSSSRKFDSHF